MENMNLASRCREAISQVASLKKEVVVYQKRQSEWGTLQKEVMQLRKQIDKNANAQANANITTNQQQQKQSVASPPGSGNGLESINNRSGNSLESINNRSSSPATDLDRIMSRQFRKQQDKTASGTATATAKSAAAESAHKTTSGGMGSKASTSMANNPANKQQRPSTRMDNNLLTSSNTKIPISVTSSKSNTTNAVSAAASQKDDEFDADIDMVDFFDKSQGLAPTNSNSNGNHGGSIESSTTVTSTHLGSQTHHARKPNSTDDHMPGDVVSGVSPSGGVGGVSPKTNAKKSPPSMGDNLLSSLDAFEASFASAFPKTSFSITSDPAPLSSAKLDMSFDVPDFDPFFKSPSHHKQEIASSVSSSSSSAGVEGGRGSGGGGTGKTNGMKSQMIQDLFPESAMNFKSISPKLDMAFDSNPTMSFTPIEKMKGGMATASTSSVAPEKLDTAFSRAQARGGGKSIFTTTPDSSSKEDKQATSHTNQRVGIGINNSLSHNHLNRPTQLSPQSMSAEIEQLDAIANLVLNKSEKSESTKNASSSGDRSGATAAAALSATATANTIPPSRTTLRPVRKGKQPVSYAEPSAKSKLRRGDVLFPKVDAAEKNKIGGGGQTTTTKSPTTDLDRIMGQMASSSTSSASPDVQ
mmetsp:Transcript_17995/g.32585  ORF Transcript_17995/g.32585 Transcript_17995/m.32585 type:complete len:642 (+) Transcript_17995:253-2178(+)